MRDWNVGINDYYKTASLILDEGPWYAFVLSDLIMMICSKIPSVPLPFGSLIKIRDKEDDKTYTINEYYGDMSDLFHLFICSPITSYCFSKIKTIHSLDYPYEDISNNKK